MNVYLDTSSLVKLYVHEAESSRVVELVNSSTYIATSIIAYAEARAAFARRFREKAFTLDEYVRIKSFLDSDWNHYLVMNISSDLIQLAGEMAKKNGLRGFDSIHLASAMTLYRELASPVLFSCYDSHVLSSALQEGLIRN
jgi:predicted nucleic acid-binding protein